jgi:hypothetical protein
MWAVAANSGGTPLGLIEISSGGNQKFSPDAAGEQSFSAAGNGTDVVGVVLCGPDLTDTCYDTVAANGAETQLTEMPNVGTTYFPSMDKHGGAWEWFSPDAGATGSEVQFYFEVNVGLVSLGVHQTHFHGGQGPSGAAVGGGECAAAGRTRCPSRGFAQDLRRRHCSGACPRRSKILRSRVHAGSPLDHELCGMGLICGGDVAQACLTHSCSFLTYRPRWV